MMNIADINQLADELDNKGLADSSIIDGNNSGEVLSKVGEVYSKFRPFLEAVSLLFFVPKKWRLAIQTFMAVMDGLTVPQSVE